MASLSLSKSVVITLVVIFKSGDKTLLFSKSNMNDGHVRPRFGFENLIVKFSPSIVQ